MPRTVALLTTLLALLLPERRPCIDAQRHFDHRGRL